jgi:4'-phosphopantetheinyl transferase
MKLPPLQKDKVNVFLLKDSSTIDSSLTAFYYQSLSAEEQHKYHRFHFEKDRRLYLHAHAMLRLYLCHYLNCDTKDLEFQHNAYGKPYLKDYPEIRFNLSHAKQVVALAMSKGEELYLGIDVENTKSRGEVRDLAFNFFSNEECELLKSYPETEQNKIFFKLWTLKESYIKAIGKGLSIGLNSFSFSSLDKDIKVKHHANEGRNFWRFQQSPVYGDYLLALALRSSKQFKSNLQIQVYDCLPHVSCQSITDLIVQK